MNERAAHWIVAALIVSIPLVAGIVAAIAGAVNDFQRD